MNSIITVIIPCFMLAISPTSIPAGPVETYEVYRDGILYNTYPADPPQFSVCETERYVAHAWHFVAKSATQISEPSDSLSIMWLHSFDVVGQNGSLAPDGIIGFADFGRFQQSYNKCNNTVIQGLCCSGKLCPTPTPTDMTIATPTPTPTPTP